MNETPKASRIAELHAKGMSTRQIAREVWGLPDDTPHRELDRKMAYVRVVLRQRNGDSYASSPADRRYYESDHGRRRINDRQRSKYALDPEYRQRRRAQLKAAYQRYKAKTLAAAYP